ncbi:ZNF358 [Branchiostoma lanceolatum]|uniref:ZNF358 protein n=1 Tax=Branchiostoma lanceolatum TaxID=7740 RepID=A0A8K0F1F4_BRALA|nr:ZNF358 [Branchiostoma lanceolatum]
MPACVVRYCKNYHGSTRGKEEVSYHRFPQDERRFHEWLIAVEPHLKPTTTIEKIREKTAKKNHGVFVCSDHFSPDCCYDNPKAKLLAPHLNRYPPKLLSDDAIPTIFGKSEDSSDSQHNKTAKKQLIEELLQSVAWEKTPPVKIPETQQTVKEEDGQEKKHSDLNNTTSKVCDGTDTVAINIKEEVLDELEESLVNCCNNTAQLLSFDTVGTDAEKEDEEVRTLGNSTSTSPQLSCRTVGTKEVHQEMGLGNCYNINTPPAAGIEIKKEGGQEMNLVNGYNTVTSQLSCSTVGTDVNEGDVQVMILANCYNNTVTSQLSCSTVGTDVNEGDVQMMNLDTVTLNCSTVVGTDVIEEDKQEMDLDSCNNTDTSQLSCSTLKTDVNEGDVQMMDLYNHYADTSLQLTCDAVGPNIAQEDDAEMTLGVSTIDEQSVNTSVIASDETSQFDPTVNLTFVRRFHTYAYCATRAAKQPAKIPAKHVRTRKPAKSKWRVRSYEIQESVPAKADYVGAGHTAADTVQDSKDAAANPALTSVPIILLQPSTASQFSNTNGKEGSKNLQSPKPKQCRKQVLEPKKVDLVFPVGLEMDACISDSTKTTSQLVLETVTDFVEDSELENKLGDDDNTMNSAVSCNVVSVDAKEEDIVEEEDDFDEELSSSEDEKKGNKSDSSWHMSSEEDELFDDSDESVSSCDSDLLEKTERRMQRKICKSKQKKKTSWVCKCQEEFTSQASYYKHKLEAHPVSCEYCEEKFLSAQTLQKHLKTHMPSEDKLDLKGNKLFMCDHCGQFFTKRQMKRHELKISEARPLDQWLIAVRPHLKPPWTVDKIRELRQSDPRAASRASICSDHFSPTCCTESLKAKLLPQGKKKDAKFVLTKDAVPTEFGKKTSRKSSESQRDKRSRKQLIQSLLESTSQQQSALISKTGSQHSNLGAATQGSSQFGAAAKLISQFVAATQGRSQFGTAAQVTSQVVTAAEEMSQLVTASQGTSQFVAATQRTNQLVTAAQLMSQVGTDAQRTSQVGTDAQRTSQLVTTPEETSQLNAAASNMDTNAHDLVEELLQPVAHEQTGQIRTPITQQTVIVKEEDNQQENLSNGDNNNTTTQLSCGTVGMDIKVEALDELEESLVNCYNNTAQLLSFDAVGTDADEEERNLGNCDNTGTCSTVGTEENQQQMDVGNSYNANTTSQLSCGTPCIEVKKEGGQVTNLGNCYNTNTPSSSTVATIEDKKEMDLELGNCYNTNPPSQLSCGTVGIKVEKNGGQETKPAQSKLPVSLYKVEECVKVDYVGPCHAVSNTSQGSNDAAANSGLTSVPMILPQPSSTRGASCVSEVSKELHLPKQKQCRKQVLEPRKADLVFPKVSEMDHNNSNKTDTSDSTPSQLKWGIVKCTNITEDGEIKKENKNNNTMTSALSWSVVTIDAKEEDVLEEEEDDFDESDEELSSSEDEKRGNKSDSSWHMSSEEDELFGDSDESMSSCDSDWLEKKEQRKQWKKKTWACCGEKFTSDASYYKHRLEAHPVSCEYCEEKFHSSRMLNKHLKTHMPSEDKLDVQGNKLFMCDHCGQFFTKQEMKRHELTISKARPFKCNVKNCKSTFKDKGGLKHHLDNVHNRHRFPCPFEGCKKTFGVKSRMMTHYRGHTDERSHQCSYCGKMFQRTDHLSVHMRIHTGDTPFNCSLCNYSGRQSNCLLWHMKTHHPEHCKKSGNIKVVKPKKKVLGKDALVDKGESDNTSGSAKKTTPYSRRTRSQRGK